RLAPDRSPHLLHQRAQADDGADADGDAKKEERQPSPRRAHLAPGHVEDEFHVASSLGWGVGSGEWGVGEKEVTSLTPRSRFPTPHSPLPTSLSSTIRPSLKLITRSA